MKRPKNHKLIRLTADIISIYHNVRLAEMFNGVNPANLSERCGFIRHWVMSKQELTPIESQFFHEQLVVKQKSFGLRWSDMERRLINMSSVAKRWAKHNDEKRLELLIRDLSNSGYYTAINCADELTLSREESRRTLTLGLVTVSAKEMKAIEDGWIKKDGLILTIRCPKPGPFIAVLDALAIAGFDIIEQDKFSAEKLVNVTVSSSRDSEMLSLLINLDFPDSLRLAVAA